MTEAVSKRSDVDRGWRSTATQVGGRLSDLASVYGLPVVFLLVMLVFGLLRPESFLGPANIDNVLVSQSVTAMLALAEMVPLATRQFDLSVGFHLGMAHVLVVALQVNAGLNWPLAVVIVLALAVLVGLANAVLITIFGSTRSSPRWALERCSTVFPTGIPAGSKSSAWTYPRALRTSRKS